MMLGKKLFYNIVRKVENDAFSPSLTLAFDLSETNLRNLATFKMSPTDNSSIS